MEKPLERKGTEKHPQNLVSERALGSEKEGSRQEEEGGGFDSFRWYPLSVVAIPHTLHPLFSS